MESSPKYRELAYRVWCENGQNLVKTVSALNRDHDFGITRQSLAKWRDEYDWEGRAARAEAAAQERADAISDHVILDSLIDQKRKYEEYFAGLGVGKIDTQAVYGYNSILKTILDIKDKIAERRKAGEKADHAGMGVARIIKTPQEAILALQEAVQNKLNIMLAQSDSVTPKSVNDLLTTLDKVDKMKAKYNPAAKDDGKKILTEEEIDNILEQIKL